MALDSAGYGGVTITKSVTIIGDGVYAGISAVSSSDGVTVNRAGITVNLRSLTIEGLGSGSDGINVTSAGTLRVEGCVIDGFINTGINVNLSADGSHIFIKDTITRNSATGISIATSSR